MGHEVTKESAHQDVHVLQGHWLLQLSSSQRRARVAVSLGRSLRHAARAVRFGVRKALLEIRAPDRKTGGRLASQRIDRREVLLHTPHLSSRSVLPVLDHISGAHVQCCLPPPAHRRPRRP